MEDRLRTFSSISIPGTSRFDIYEDTPNLATPYGPNRIVATSQTKKQVEDFFEKMHAENEAEIARRQEKEAEPDA